jgi:carboxyl-terminal processing protease
MDKLKSTIKSGVPVILIMLLLVAVFALGYRAGSRTGNDDADSPGDPSSLSQVNPTATAPTGLTATPFPQDTSSAASSPNAEEPAATASSGPAEESLKVLHEVWDIIDAEFYGELPSPQQRTYAAIRGMLATLDDENTFFSEADIAEIRRSDRSGTFEGIGASVTTNEENILQILQTFKGSPAEEAGLLPGDLILAVDGRSIVGLGLVDAITFIRGPEGTEVTLTVARGNAEPFDVTIIRARLEIPVLESQMLEEDIGYVRLFRFSSLATSHLETAIGELLDQGATALIFDLRSNGGGLRDQAVGVADLFLEQGLVVIQRGRDGEQVEFTSTDEGLAQDIPLVVLVNPGSASGSELVAGALQDRDRALLIGETTFGKGSVQVLFPLSDRSELRVTVEHWFTPDDRAIDGEGLTPDIEVPLTPEDFAAGRDPQLDRAIEYLKTGQ